VTEGIRHHLLEQGMSDESLSLIPNGARIDLFTPGPIDRDLRRKLEIKENAFIVVYTGLHGLIHGMETILKAAKLLLSQSVDEQNLQFLLVGDGVIKSKLIAEARKMSLTNIRFLKAQPEASLPRFIRSANVGLATTARLPLTKGSLPVKMFSYMACARPVVLAADGEARELIESAKCGLCVAPEDGEALAEAIMKLAESPALCNQLGANGRRFVEIYYSREKQSKELERVLRKIIDI
jgi:glycosyltransferase involved in cell wall biosynthesis